ncbi:hypothetical protein BDF14DRAFT_1864962, partial [Spinellus fusiger]
MNMLMKRSNPYNFDGNQRVELYLASLIPTITTIVFCSIVVLSHFFIRYYKPDAVNRLSLRLVVIACFITLV